MKTCSFEFEKKYDKVAQHFRYKELSWVFCCDDLYGLLWDGSLYRELSPWNSQSPAIGIRHQEGGSVVDFCPFCGAKIEVSVWENGTKTK
jgi:hypothetical protein